MDRNSFLKNGFKLLKGAVLENTVPNTLKRNINKELIRPPGYVDKDTFFKSCNSCGDCQSACPENVISMEKDYDTVIRPVITNTTYCYYCVEKNCIKSCKENALLIDQDKIKANIQVNESECLAFLGSMCQVCHDICPEKGTAITMNDKKPVFNSDFCLFCYKCIDHCLGEADTISIIPLNE